MLPPCVGAFALEDERNALDALARGEMMTAARAVEHGDGNAPRALTADTPILALAHHATKTRFTGCGQPLDSSRLRERRLHAGVHVDKPLRRFPQKHRRVAAPAF